MVDYTKIEEKTMPIKNSDTKCLLNQKLQVVTLVFSTFTLPKNQYYLHVKTTINFNYK